MILVVDDDIDLVDIVRSALEREGFAVDDAGDGETALTKIAGDSPELVVLDLGLPKVRGLDVLRRVREDNPVPVIVLSGMSDEADRIVGLELDLTTREAWVRGEIVELRRREFDLLAFLCASPRQVFTRDQLLLYVWEVEPEWQGAATVSEHVHRLRAKIEDDPAHPNRIVTVRGVGYRFEP